MGEKEVNEEMESSMEKRTITILVNGKVIVFDTDNVTGSQIRAKAGVAPDSILYELKGENRIPVGDNEQIKIHEDERFLAVPGGTVS